MDYLQSVKDLEDLIERYHGRDGTFNFHYSHFDLLAWRVWIEDEGLSRANYERMETEDYAVQIAYTDNSMSYDCYTVLLKDIIAWGEEHEAK
jgi:hypothetical protein